MIEYAAGKYGIKNRHVPDVTGGTGNLPGMLFQNGFLCTGSDLSEDMIAIARQRYPDIPFNSVNHLLSKHDLIKMFRSIKKILAEDSIYILDFSADKLYKNHFAGAHKHDYSDVMFMQICEYDRLHRIGRTNFIYQGLREERHEQRAYSCREILDMIDAAGFEILDSFGHFDMSLQDGDSLRYIFRI